MANIDCSICTNDINNSSYGEKITTICMHTYHSKCIIEWVNTCMRDTKDCTCPICRSLMFRYNGNNECESYKFFIENNVDIINMINKTISNNINIINFLNMILHPDEKYTDLNNINRRQIDGRVVEIYDDGYFVYNDELVVDGKVEEEHDEKDTNEANEEDEANEANEDEEDTNEANEEDEEDEEDEANEANEANEDEEDEANEENANEANVEHNEEVNINEEVNDGLDELGDTFSVVIKKSGITENISIKYSDYEKIIGIMFNTSKKQDEQQIKQNKYAEYIKLIFDNSSKIFLSTAILYIFYKNW